MKIFHYIFGMPPLRGGGTIKYALDLAEMQEKLGHDVSVIYPGEIKKTTNQIRIERRKNLGQVKLWEIINPLPVSLVTGIRETDAFMKKGDMKVYLKFFEKEQVDILHVHSLMGAHKELFEAAKVQHVKLVFTTHDYFGICPKTNLLYKGNICRERDWGKCKECCAEAESVSTLVMRQSHWFQWGIRHKKLVYLKKFISKRISRLKKEDKQQEDGISCIHSEAKGYEKLRHYYLEELVMMDLFLYNSSVTKQHYEKRIIPSRSMIIGGMHKEFGDQRTTREYGTVLKIAYLGYPVDFKGYPMLIRVLDELDREFHSQFSLTVYMEDPVYERNYICCKEMFSYGQLSEVYRNMDILVVPSLCAETYGLVVAEAMSYGVPAIVTENVGASDLIRKNEGTGFIVQADDKSVKQILERIIRDRSLLERANWTINHIDLNFDYRKYVENILKTYQRKDIVNGQDQGALRI